MSHACVGFRLQSYKDRRNNPNIHLFLENTPVRQDYVEIFSSAAYKRNES
jgi:hypothetical protein